MRVALVHDYLVQEGGSERVLHALHELFPDAPIFTLFHAPDTERVTPPGARIITSHLQQAWGVPRWYQWYVSLMPHAIELLDFSGYDLVISNTSNYAKGVIVPPSTRHVCYLHTPTRFLWHDRVGYVMDLPYPRWMKRLIPHFLHRQRQWDHIAAQRPDVLLTNSRTSQARIARYYQRDAQVIYPPVDVDQIPLSPHAGSFWLTGGRLVPYKRFDLTVRAFAKLNLPLKIFGDGPEASRLKRYACPKTEFLGRIDDKTKAELYAHAIGFIHPQLEDFGITAVEAMAAGKPIIAFDQGGARETVIDGVTGHFFSVPCWEDIGNAVIRFDAKRFDPTKIRAHALQFSKQAFLARIRTVLTQEMSRERV